jgi:membrane protein implicated in regulation of membrane protease activity
MQDWKAFAGSALAVLAIQLVARWFKARDRRRQRQKNQESGPQQHS